MIVFLQNRFEQVVRLHICGIPTGFISSLGEKFITELYKAVSEDENSFCLVAQEDEQVLGFVAFSCNLSKLYKYVLKSKFSRFAPKIITFYVESIFGIMRTISIKFNYNQTIITL
jgi:hypothetical protein